ncbi:hypothetical protein K470DRAFT_258341 [Piedraia hortae CBS 480.64]|uniref:PH domain-containing protein n=1 Tax=Piedraia hortae CBS 480.64 TaxID=1314780 RepID=A0A6A7BXP6_9PEZI|nr:hypothetical protein K470DRAFT_258341 [Piedraia hortae CBS 480.64]
MAGVVGKYAAQKLLGSQMKRYADKKVDTGIDPFFAMVEDPKRPGKMKKVKKQIPAYIPEHDALILAKVRKSAYRLDMCLFNLFGIRFGWDSVVGLVPMAGDAIGLALAYMVFAECCKVDGGLPAALRMKMVLNILMDFAVGLIPIVGDLVDAAFKCNSRNLRLLEVHLDSKYRPASAPGRDARLYSNVDREERRKKRQSGIYDPRDPPPATVFEDFGDEAEERARFMQESSAPPYQSRSNNAPPARSTRAPQQPPRGRR